MRVFACCLWLVSCCLLLTASKVHAADARYVAVIGVGAGEARDLADLVSTELAAAESVQLVERDRIAQILDEQSLTSLATGTAASRLGRLLKADVLALISREVADGAASHRLILCDVATGARIGQSRIADHPAVASRLADDIRQSIARFPRGVTAIVAIPDLISRDLTLDQAHLQSALPDLLREALTQQQGIAVVEVDEARAIAGELDLAGGTVLRTACLFLEGEYRTDMLARGGATIDISVSLHRPAMPVTRLQARQILLADAPGFILDELRPAILRLLEVPVAAAADLEREFHQFIRRADLFAEVAEYERAISLREAALLLKPDNTEQRVRLVREYIRHNSRPFAERPAAKDREQLVARHAAIVARCQELWRRSLVHTEYLICNRRVDMETGAELYGGAIRSITGIRGSYADQLVEEEQLKKRFVRRVAPALCALTPTRRGTGIPVDLIIERAWMRCDGNFVHEEDLALIGDLICNLLPDNTPVSYYLLYRLADGVSMFEDPKRNATPESWHAFLDRLAASDRPLAKAYARLGEYEHRYLRVRERSNELLEAFRSLHTDISQPPLRALDPDGRLARDAHEYVRRLEHDLKITAPRPVPPRPAAPVVAPVTNDDGSITSQHITLTPISLKLQGAGGDPLKKRWRAAGGYSPWQRFLPAWDGIDIIYGPGALLYVYPDRTARVVIENPALSIQSAVFDGENLWVSGGYDRGIYVFDRDGNTRAHITAEHGLPSAYVSMPLAEISPGKALAAGSISQSGRSWIAAIDITGDTPSVNIFHEAVKVAPQNADVFEVLADPHIRFGPAWIITHRDDSGHWALISRSWSPLIVDLKTLSVSQYALRKNDNETYFPRTRGPEDAYLSHDGLLYIAGSTSGLYVTKFDLSTRLLQRVIPADRGIDMGGLDAGSLVVHEDDIIYAGQSRWLRYRPATRQSEILIDNPRALPGYGSGRHWRLSQSRCFGLITWHDGNLYQLALPQK